MSSTDFTSLCNVRYPIIQAPMAGASTPEMAAAVSNAGGLGSLAAAYSTPDQIREMVARMRQLTDQPFNVNLFAIEFPPAPEDVSAALALVAPFYQELGIGKPERPVAGPTFEEQARVLIELEIPIFSFTFGVPSPAILQAFKSKGIKIIGTATTVAEGKILKAAGVDAIVAQGSEAGAHRGTFNHPFEQAMVSTIALAPQMARSVSLPVIASGGIMNGKGIRAALELGAAAVQLGTAFLVCPESSIPECYKKAVLNATDDSTRITRAFSGRPARGIHNHFMRAGEAHPEAVLAFPWQNNLTRPMRNAAARTNNPEMLSLWAGQAAALARPMKAADLVKTLAREAGW